tara:strand:- start:365 stop:556 length:192 start_codon:yes stop_codon:yes gene_type:complete
MKQYEIVGKLLKNNKRGKSSEQALDKQEVWGNPQSFGFSKVFSVTEAKVLRSSNKRDYNEEVT